MGDPAGFDTPRVKDTHLHDVVIAAQESRLRLMGYAIGLMVLLGLVTPLSLADLAERVSIEAVFIAVLVCGLWAVTALMALRIVRPVRLLLSPTGFCLTNWRRWRCWDDVEDFTIVYRHIDFWRRRLTYRNHPPGAPDVGWRLKPDARRSLVRQANRLVAGVDGTMPHTLKMAPDEMLLLLRAWQGRYGTVKPAADEVS